MAKINSTARHPFDADPLCDKAVARMFETSFPTIHLNRFAAFRVESSVYTSNHHTIDVSGSMKDLIGNGMIDAQMLPGRKRKCFRRFAERDNGPSTMVWVRRCRGGIVEALFHLHDDDALPADHPLQMFHPRLWPFGELRTAFERDRAEGRRWLTAMLDPLLAGPASKYGYMVHAADWVSLQQMVCEFRDRLLEAYDKARVVSTRARQRFNSW